MTVNNPQLDATNKLRTSAPQALIDTDFEYGTQVSKWENLSTTNLRPYAYTTGANITGTISDIQTTAGSRVVTVTGSGFSFSPASYGLPLVIQDTLNPVANGVFAIDTGSAPSATSFTYLARSAATSAVSIFDTYKTQISQASYYTNAAIGTAPTITFVANKIKVVTTVPHGLSIGNEIQVTGTVASTSGAPNGAWVVSQVENPTTFYFYSSVTPVGTISGGLVYPRPQGAILHRPFDGGVIFSSNGSSNYEATTRQTRRYFRYQSGKGIQFSSGTILKPNFQLDGLTYTQSTGLVTVTTKDQHNLQPGSSITISGANEAFFNGTFTAYSVTGYNTFTYAPLTNPGVNTTASGTFYVSIVNWYGAVNRLGIFDQQNGLFFEFDGQTLYAVRRNSTYQISGRVSVNAGSNTVTQATGFTTIFSKQLSIGDYIVLRGQSYRVDAIASDTSMTISPSYRGADNVVATSVTKTIDTKVPQSQWNLDKMDGSGANGTNGSTLTAPSGYVLDLSRMQMFYIDYSWYGAGFIRWGLRGTDGDVTYVHKLANNNANFEAYMRSGNLPGRYESVTQPPITAVTADLSASGTTLVVTSTANFPSSGTLFIKSGSTYEHVNYTGKTDTTFTGLIRAQAGATVASGLTTVVGSNSIVNSAAFTGVQIGQRVISNTANAVYPDGTFITAISADAKTLTLSQALTGSTAALSVTYIPMGATTGQAFTYSATAPIGVELAFPTFAPTISHWGTSAIMDGRFDDDKSLLFTYGQTTATGLGSTSPVSLGTTNVSSVGAVFTVPSGTQNVVVGQSVSPKTAGTGVLQGEASVNITVAANTAPSYTAPNITLVTSAAHNFVNGQSVTITGAVPAAYNGTWVAQTGTTGGSNLVINVGGNPGAVTTQGAVVGVTLVTAVNSTTTFTVNPAPSTAFASATTTVSGASQKALFSIRVAPSVDNGKAANFGRRDLVNRMQLVLRNLDIALQGSTFGNLLVTAVLNGVPTVSTTWNALSSPTSSLAQIADHSTATTAPTVTGGEVTGGFFVNGTNSIDLSIVRDLGNSILGGGTTVVNTGIYPDGPDVLTIVVQNLNSLAAAQVVGRLSWTEAQA